MSGCESLGEGECDVLADLRARLDAAERENARLRSALERINEIRNSIVGVQGFNWSEHAYPMVSILDGNGFVGMDYPEARANVGTLIERANAAEKERDAAQAEVARLTKENDWLHTVNTEAIISLSDSERFREQEMQMACGWAFDLGVIRRLVHCHWCDTPLTGDVLAHVGTCKSNPVVAQRDEATALLRRWSGDESVPWDLGLLFDSRDFLRKVGAP